MLSIRRGFTIPELDALLRQLDRVSVSVQTARWFRVCATVRFGQQIPFTAFNTACWDGSGVDLTLADVPKIDNMTIQIPSDDKQSYTINDFCLTGVYFDSLPPGLDAGGVP